jgi:hypothetical protein
VQLLSCKWKVLRGFGFRARFEAAATPFKRQTVAFLAPFHFHGPETRSLGFIAGRTAPGHLKNRKIRQTPETSMTVRRENIVAPTFKTGTFLFAVTGTELRRRVSGGSRERQDKKCVLLPRSDTPSQLQSSKAPTSTQLNDREECQVRPFKVPLAARIKTCGKLHRWWHSSLVEKIGRASCQAQARLSNPLNLSWQGSSPG